MTEIHCRMSDKELNQYGIQIGEMLYPDIVAKRYDHACSDMISMCMLCVIADMSCVCNHKFSEIKDSLPLMTKWINFAKIAKCLRTAVEKWNVPISTVVFDESFLKTNMEDYPQKIQEDLCVFCGWAIYRGADGASIRKGVSNQMQKSIQKIIKCRGDGEIINRFWRALVAFVSISEKCIEPIYPAALKKLKHGYSQDAGFNTMRAALNQATK